MRKNNRGVALAYTLMMMLLVFTICAVITTAMLSQLAYTDMYSDNAEIERISTQIGELFYISGGDSSSFESALSDNSVDKGEDGWIVEFDEHRFLLCFNSTETAYTLEIKSSGGTTTYLTVCISGGEIVEWTKGNL